MSEALRQRAQHLPPALRERLPAQAATVHRLLGAFPGGFTHHAGRPLAIDALVVDEASMLDLALATQLLEAVPDSARLILLGDKDQLAAVESGAVFAELSADPTLSAACIDDLARLCELPAAAIVPGAPLQASPLRDSVVWLSRNFRFAADSGIALAAASVRDGHSDALLQRLRQRDDDALHWLDDGGAAPAPATWQCMRDGYAAYLQAVRDDGRDVAAITQAFERFRVLCAVREGRRGVEAINRQLADEARALLAPGTHHALVHRPAGDGAAQRPAAQAVQRRHRHRAAGRRRRAAGALCRRGRRLPRGAAAAPAAARDGVRDDGAQGPGLGVRRGAGAAARAAQSRADARVALHRA